MAERGPHGIVASEITCTSARRSRCMSGRAAWIASLLTCTLLLSAASAFAGATPDRKSVV